MATAAGPDYAPTDSMSTPNFFNAALGGADDGTNYFDQQFRSDPTSEPQRFASASTEDIDPTLIQNDFLTAAPGPFAQSMADPIFSPFVGFSGNTSPEPADGRSTRRHDGEPRAPAKGGPDSSDLGYTGAWGDGAPADPNGGLQRSDASQEHSPPHAADSPVEQWANQPPQAAAKSGRVKTRHGQITPPSDGSPTSPVAKDSTYTWRNSSGRVGPTSHARDPSVPDEEGAPPPRKRGRKSAAAAEASPEATLAPAPAKRARKATGKGRASDAHRNEETDKRQRFLERNRVAASKCRQKKKEWTGNLEGRARDLQGQEAQLSLIVGSLRDEVLFLKGELLKHTNCGCDRIRQYLDQEVNNLAGNGGASGVGGHTDAMGNRVSRISPVRSAPRDSARSSVDVDAMRTESDRSIDSARGSTYLRSLSTSTSPVMPHASAKHAAHEDDADGDDDASPEPAIKSEDDQKLHQLLSEQIAQ